MSEILIVFVEIVVAFLCVKKWQLLWLSSQPFTFNQ